MALLQGASGSDKPQPEIQLQIAAHKKKTAALNKSANELYGQCTQLTTDRISTNKKAELVDFEELFTSQSCSSRQQSCRSSQRHEIVHTTCISYTMCTIIVG